MRVICINIRFFLIFIINFCDSYIVLIGIYIEIYLGKYRNLMFK